MKTTPKPQPVTLDFSDAPKAVRQERIRDFSAVVQCGQDLWLASDETTTLERLSPTGGVTFGSAASFRLAQYLELPASEDEETDTEGLAFEGHYLWLAGSHSLKREKAKGKDAEDDIDALRQIVRETNRFLIARIPVRPNPDTGRMEFHQRCVDPDHPKRALTAAQLIGTSKSNLLIDALRDDDHLGRFLQIPSKENGLDIEGLAVLGSRIFLGLRGPVLRGWAVILEIKIEMISPSLFRLLPIGPDKNLYRKHFFDLGGLGIRELTQHNDDLLILAGPTMDLDGHVLVFRWRNLKKHRKQTAIGRSELEVVLSFEFASARKPGEDHPEGMCLFSGANKQPGLLIVYDSPSKRRLRKQSIMADLFPLD